MGRRTDENRQSPAAGALVHDEDWAGALRTASVSAATLLALLLLVDAVGGALTAPRAALWAGLAALLFVVLLPDRVTAGACWLASRGLLREKRVRTDWLVSVRRPGGDAQRLALQDIHGVRLELDMKVLTANPPIWQLLEQGAHASCERGVLTFGETDWRQLSRRIDRDTARLVFKVSGLGLVRWFPAGASGSAALTEQPVSSCTAGPPRRPGASGAAAIEASPRAAAEPARKWRRVVIGGSLDHGGGIRACGGHLPDDHAHGVKCV
ncbi:hypothetical protein [Streptomyces sp. RerS4]|uniref:hypothetical protein n=1 Tax=Streptomyces sp. RerS4 TaxID=2942449 RepID=UPI00201C0A97|nr:hypothetical protein [Streptomyces sp. RerS4]UQX04129.1 hypothetical protein M4D82_29235 [Streptomyces sp. RerS4]